MSVQQTKKKTVKKTEKEPIAGEFFVSKKVLAAFKQCFQTVFDRRLTTLFAHFAEDDIYIVSDESPYYLMAGNSKTSFGYIDLSKAEDEIRLGIRKMVLYLGGPDVAIRSDYLTQLVNNYAGEVFPAPITATNESREDVWVYWRRSNIADYPVEKIRKIVGDKDYKDKNSSHLLKAVWPTGGGFFRIPLIQIKELFESFIKNDHLNADFIPGDRNDLSERRFGFAGNDYSIVPINGVDTLNLDKVKNLLGSRILLKEESSRIFSYATYAMIGDKEHNTTIMITRPDIVLYPLKRSSS